MFNHFFNILFHSPSWLLPGGVPPSDNAVPYCIPQLLYPFYNFFYQLCLFQLVVHVEYFHLGLLTLVLFYVVSILFLLGVLNAYLKFSVPLLNIPDSSGISHQSVLLKPLCSLASLFCHL